MVHIIQLRVARSVRFHMAHVAFVARGGIWPGMRLAAGIEMRACGTGIGCTAIAKFVNVKAVLTRGQTRDFRVNLYAVSNRREGDGAAHFVACSGMQHGNGF